MQLKLKISKSNKCMECAGAEPKCGVHALNRCMFQDKSCFTLFLTKYILLNATYETTAFFSPEWWKKKRSGCEPIQTFSQS